MRDRPMECGRVCAVSGLTDGSAGLSRGKAALGDPATDWKTAMQKPAQYSTRKPVEICHCDQSF